MKRELMEKLIEEARGKVWTQKFQEAEKILKPKFLKLEKVFVEKGFLVEPRPFIYEIEDTSKSKSCVIGFGNPKRIPMDQEGYLDLQFWLKASCALRCEFHPRSVYRDMEVSAIGSSGLINVEDLDEAFSFFEIGVKNTARKLEKGYVFMYRSDYSKMWKLSYEDKSMRKYAKEIEQKRGK